jgi:uncharacterized membrane protein
VSASRLLAGAPRRALAPTVVVGLCAFVVVLGAFAQRLPCTASARNPQGQLELNWSNGRPFDDYCYSDVIALYLADHLDQPGEFPYQTSWIENPGTNAQQRHYVEYPVLTGLLMWAGASVASALARTGALSNLATVVIFFDVVALALAACWLFVVGALSALLRARPRDALLAALSPLVLVQLFTNFDALAIAFATAGLLAWARRRPVLAGVMLGLGGAAKLYPLLLLIPILVLCLRAGELRSGLRALGAAVASWVLVNAPFAILFPSGWAFFWRFSAMRGAGFESLFNILAYFTGLGLDGHLAPNQTPTALNIVSGVVFVAGCAAICAVALSAPRRPRLAPLCLLVVIAFLLSGKVYSPQYSLWLVPLAVLAVPRWRVLVPWMVIDALVWVPTMLFNRGAANGGIGEGYFLAAVLTRDVVLVALCAVVLREIYRPAHDLLRAGGEDDGCGGVLDGAPDRVTLGRRGLAFAS